MNIKIISIIALFVIMSGGSIYIKILQSDLRAVKAEIKLVQAEKETAVQNYTQCLEDKKITNEVSNEYQNQLSISNTELDHFKRMFREATCINIASPSSQPYDSTKEGKHGQPNGLRSDWLLDYAGEAEGYRLQVIGLQNFIKKTWKSRNQEDQ